MTLFRDVSGLLNPRSIALVGASEKPGNWLKRVYDNLKTFGFAGSIYPVNPSYTTLYGEPCYPDVRAIPEPVDHLVILLRASLVPGILADAASNGCRSATIMSAGFSEAATPEGHAAHEALLAAADAHGIRVCGPNCLGNIALPAHTVTYCEQVVENYKLGGLSFVSHSSAVMGTTFRYAAQRGVGVRYGVSAGNEVNTDVADYLSFLADDPGTKVIGLFVEGIRRPDAFVAACEKVARAGKPVMLLPAGRSQAARQATLTHTGAVAGSREVLEAVLDRYGLITVHTADEMVEFAELATRVPAMRPEGLAVINLSGGYRGLCCDLADEFGIPLAPLTPDTQARLQALMDVGSAAGNPLDVGWAGISDRNVYLGCLRAFMEDETVSAVAIQEELPRGELAAKRAEGYLEMEAIGREYDKPVVFFSRGTNAVTDFGLAFHERATAPYLQEVRRSFFAIASYMAFHRRNEEARRPRSLPPESPHAADWRQLMAADGPLSDEQAFGLLAEAGLPVAPWRLADSPAEAVAAARALGVPVALKLSAPGLLHKTEHGAVRLGLTDEPAVVAAAADLLASEAARAPGARLLVQAMAPSGAEILLSCTRDPQFGPMLTVGLGGIWVEVMRDVCLAPAPIDAVDARAMLQRLRGRAILRGVRGAPPRDEEALVSAMVALSALGVALGDTLDTIELNPFILGAEGQGGIAVDALIVPPLTAAPAGDRAGVGAAAPLVAARA